MARFQKLKTKYKPSIGGALHSSMLGLIFLVVLIFVIVMASTGLSLDDIAFRTLDNYAEGSTSQIQSELTMVSRGATLAAGDLGLKHQALLEAAGKSPQDAEGDTELLDQLLSSAYGSSLGFLGNNAATGAFVVLNSGYSSGQGLACVYIRNPDPSPPDGRNATNYTLLRGPVHITGDDRLTLEKSWFHEQPLLDGDSMRFVTAPQEAARLFPKSDHYDWGYWSRPFRLSQEDSDIITFTTPLPDGNGGTLGVFGVEFTLSYFSRLIPREELPFNNGFHLVGMLGADNVIPADASFTESVSGNRFLSGYPQGVPLTLLRQTSDYTSYTSRGTGKIPEHYFSYSPLNLYSESSPFLDEQYYLFAVAPKEQVLDNSRKITVGIGIALGCAALVGLVASAALSRFFASGIKKLATEVQKLDPGQPVHLSPTNIREIDALSNAMVAMGRNLIQYAARMSTIVDLVGLPIGAFEIQEEDDQVYLTESLFNLLNIVHKDEDSHYMPIQRFLSFLPVFSIPVEENIQTEEEVLWTNSASISEQWLRVQLLRQGEVVYGTITDITGEVQQKKRLEFERDYDPLTRLLNRNSYPGRMNAAIGASPKKTGVLLFGDLDNLKYINDTFGHDMGDRYIQMAAKAFLRFEQFGGVVARVSGDEFVVYLHGAGSRDDLRGIVNTTLEKVRQASMELPDGSPQKVCVSVGLAYYPEDSTEIETLVKYADFAMYEVKHSKKGGTREFNKAAYEKSSYVLHKQNHLDLLIESHRLRFAFQPVIDVRTGEVFGYEAFMRPQMREFHTPDEVLALARAQSKLYQIELLTVASALKWYNAHQESIGDRKLLINLIPNQIISQNDLLAIRPLFPDDGKRLVMEFTEPEKASAEILAQKAKLIRDIGCEIALNDYGDGCNAKPVLLSVKPDYIKANLSIVRNIDTDPDNQLLLRQIVDYANENQILVIAEGIETSAELETVISLGARYVQGFYTGTPELELDMHDRDACREAAGYYKKHFFWA